MDEFDEQFADELEALGELDQDPPSPKPRRSLNFTTPKSKLGSSEALGGINSPLKNGTLLLNSGQKKRGRHCDSQSDSDLEYGEEDLKVSAPVNKKSKVDIIPDEELWDDEPKQSPKIKGLHDHKGRSKVISAACLDLVEAEQDSPDHRLMQRIIEHRSKHVGRELKLDNKDAAHADRLLDGYDYERPRVHRRIPAGTAFLATTGTEGNRVYMKVKDDLQYEQQFGNIGKTMQKSNLLSVPIIALREQLEEERRAHLLAESQSLSENIHRVLDEDDQGFQDEEGEGDEEHALPLPLPQGPQKLLWVDKYTPARYTDLLSEEHINRSLLHWLKMWDYVVFNKDLPLKIKEKKKEEPKKFKKKNQPEVLDELDKHLRPLQKVALLCGPPGLGKTTLAHIIARHAGYNVIEMNASDDRSAEVFKNKIESSTQMKAVLGPDPRPNCLVIDEIDGAPEAAINVLLNVIRKTDAPEGKEVKEGKKKKKEEGGILRRPIICICNDQYVPALRLLRQNALIINFPQTDPTKLAARLHEVIRLENIRSDMNTLLALCEKTDNDIRSCLNTLQFIKGRSKELSLRNIQSLTVGQKDSHKSLFSVWYDVLTLPKPKRQKFVNVHESNTRDLVLNTSQSARFSNVLSLVQGAGENEKVTQGLFENYLECKFKDPYMDGVSMATDWLCFNDQLTEYIQHQQDYSLMPYLFYLSVGFHFLFASNTPPKIQYPHAMADCHQRLKKSENLVTAMLADISPAVRKYLNLAVVIGDILPPLMDIIQPTFRPVNTQLYSSKEKEDLRHLVSTMISYNLTYIQEKSLEGQYNYILEPHVEEAVRFPGMPQHKQLTYSSKQLVAREIELEKMRRSEIARAPKPEPKETTKNTPGKPGVHAASTEGEKTPVVPSHLQRLTAKPLGKQEEVPVKDFFGRVLKCTTPEAKAAVSDEPKKTNVLATDIWFHFQGGYSNAVRRNVRVKEFF